MLYTHPLFQIEITKLKLGGVIINCPESHSRCEGHPCSCRHTRITALYSAAVNEREVSEMSPTYVANPPVPKEARISNGEKTAFSVVVLGKLGSYKQQNETGLLSYTIYKNKLKMD